MFKVRRGNLVQGKEQWLCFAGAAVKRFPTSKVRVAHQAPLSMEFSRQEHWGGLPFPFPMHESALAPHERLPEILVVPREKTPTGAAARGNP